MGCRPGGWRRWSAAWRPVASATCGGHGCRCVRCGCSSRTAPRRRWAACAGGSPGGGWLRGVQDVAFDATDNAGIRLDRIALDGRVVRDHGARVRLHAAGAVPERAGERVVRHARLGRRRACAGAVGAGRGGQLGVGLAHGAGGQHGARGAGARPGGRRRVEPGADADARAAGAARAGRAARARAREGVPGGRALRGVVRPGLPRAARPSPPRSPRSTGRASTGCGWRSRTRRGTSARSPRR